MWGTVPAMQVALPRHQDVEMELCIVVQSFPSLALTSSALLEHSCCTDAGLRGDGSVIGTAVGS